MPVPAQRRRMSRAGAGPRAVPSGGEVANPSDDRSRPTATREAWRRTCPSRYCPTMRGAPADTPFAQRRIRGLLGSDRTEPVPLRGGDPGAFGAHLSSATHSATDGDGENEGQARTDLHGAHHAYGAAFLRSCRVTSRFPTEYDGSTEKTSPEKRAKNREGVFSVIRASGAGALPRLYELNRMDHYAPERNSPKHSHHLLTWQDLSLSQPAHRAQAAPRVRSCSAARARSRNSPLTSRGISRG